MQYDIAAPVRLHRPLLAALMGLSLAHAACMVPLDEDDAELETEELGHAEEEIICGSQDWDDAWNFANDPDHRIGAHYARGVAQTTAGGNLCSAPLVSPDTLITAQHCGSPASLTANFGVGWSNAIPYAQGRLQDLGLSAAQANAVPPNTLSSFNCTFKKTYGNDAGGNRDLDVYDCSPNWISGLGFVSPGDIWGFLEIQSGTRAEGTDTYVLSVNRKFGANGDRLMLSPDGTVHDEYDNCHGPWGYGNCFEHDADTKPGSSGGAILDGNHRLFGLVKGNYDASIYNDCPTFATNYGTYLPYNGFSDSWVIPDSLPSPSNGSMTIYAGGMGGTASVQVCPANYLAAGIIGTTYSFDPTGNARVGNIGLVCVPFKRANTPSSRPMESWQALAGGSIDTTLSSYYGPFNEIIHERLDRYDDFGAMAGYNDQQQSLTMCKAGFYMTGVRIEGGSHLDQVVHIECSRWDGLVSNFRTPRKAIGTRSGTARTLRCTNADDSASSLPDRAIFGLYVRSGWLTDGVRFFCRSY
jgi:hypothetical protein